MQSKQAPSLSRKCSIRRFSISFHRKQMAESEQALEAAVINVENAVQLIGLATAVAVGKWRDTQKIILSKTKRVTVQSSKDIPIFLDGERVKVGKKAEISFVPSAVNVIVPARGSANEHGSRHAIQTHERAGEFRGGTRL